MQEAVIQNSIFLLGREFNYLTEVVWDFHDW